MAARWSFVTLDGVQTYNFPINPNDQSSPVPSRSVSWSQELGGAYTGTRDGRLPHPWSFSGVLRTPEQHAAFVEWVRKRTKIRLTTDLGQRYVVRLLTFKPTQAAGARARLVPWRHTYTIDCLIFETESVLP